MTAMNKSVLAQRRRDLEVYARVLPSLDLKRRQLAALLADERARLAQAESRFDSALQAHAARLPMLARDDLPFDGLWQIEAGAVGVEDTLLGVRVPALTPPAWKPAPLGLVTLPAWTDEVAAAVRELAVLQVEQTQRQQRIQALQAAVRHTLQRVNLFERVLIPRARAEIRAIRVFLADAERTAIVRAKQGRALLHRRMQAQAGQLGARVGGAGERA